MTQGGQERVRLQCPIEGTLRLSISK